MKKLLLVDGNSIMNRGFYGINIGMKNNDGKSTNALYGFLSILFKNCEDIKPDYLMVAFDSKTGANTRKEMYDGYKKSRHGMPEELAEQMPEIKEILDDMGVTHVELPDFEGDDIIGTTAKKFASDDVEVWLLSGDRDLFQLLQKNIKILIPRTKMGKTETDIYDEKKLKEEYGLTPSGMIELKALMGDSSDEIPGAPGVGPKTATKLLQKFGTINKIYKAIDLPENAADFKPKVKQSLLENKELVELSKKLGTIRLDANVTDNIEEFSFKNWKNSKTLADFKYYGFNRFIERFHLDENGINEAEQEEKEKNVEIIAIEKAKDFKTVKDLNCLIYERVFFYVNKEDLDDENKIIKKKILGICFYNEIDKNTYYLKNDGADFFEIIKPIFENKDIEKIGYDVTEDYVLLKENGIKTENIAYDVEVAAYDIDAINVRHKLEETAEQYLKLTLPELNEGAFAYLIYRLYNITKQKLEESGTLKLFNTIEMPLVEVLSEMQYNGMKCDSEELAKFGISLKERLNQLTNEIYEIAGEEFNINSTKQLGVILFEKLGLKAKKKTKSGYSTSEEVLNSLIDDNPIIEKILEYRGLMKLNSTYVDGLIPYINKKTGRIHSYFHQTITATGRISSTNPNLQNIPARDEFGKNIKKAFKPEKGYVYIDADYSQVELRVLAHISGDENMIRAFNNDEDIHREVASKVFDVPFEEVTKEQRSRAKAVNFGIVYGITSFGLAKQIGASRKQAQEYIDNYLEKYSGIKAFMEESVEMAKQNGYVETLFGRRRNVPELKSSNFMMREFGKRVAMNTPIQGTAADIMKIAMNNVYKELKAKNIDAKLILQVHDELLIEASEKDAEETKNILKNCMENAMKLKVPLKVELSEAQDWYEVK